MYRELKKMLYMNLETTRLRGGPRNRWRAEVREDDKTGGGKGWPERVYNREIEEAPENGKEPSYSAHSDGMYGHGPCMLLLLLRRPSTYRV
jgi:hypothetical protein